MIWYCGQVEEWHLCTCILEVDYKLLTYSIPRHVIILIRFEIIIIIDRSSNQLLGEITICHVLAGVNLTNLFLCSYCSFFIMFLILVLEWEKIYIQVSTKKLLDMSSYIHYIFTLVNSFWEKHDYSQISIKSIYMKARFIDYSTLKNPLICFAKHFNIEFRVGGRWSNYWLFTLTKQRN